jgi:hypothetical protein
MEQENSEYRKQLHTSWSVQFVSIKFRKQLNTAWFVQFVALRKLFTIEQYSIFRVSGTLECLQQSLAG